MILDALGILEIELAALHQVDQAGLEAPLHLRRLAAAGREREVLEAELVDRRGPLVDQLATAAATRRPRRKPGAERKRAASTFIQMPATFCFSRTTRGWTGPFTTTAMSACSVGVRPPG